MTTGVEVLDKSVQETNEWLKSIEQRLGLHNNRRQCYQALRATLHAVRDRIGADHAVNLSAQLPVLLRGVFFENWKPLQTPTRERTKAAFLQKVESTSFKGLGLDPERAIRAVLDVMAEHVDPHEVIKLAQLFPLELRDLWPVAVAGEA